MVFVFVFGVFKIELGESFIFLNFNFYNIEFMLWLRYFLLVFCCKEFCLNIVIKKFDCENKLY